MRRHVLRFFALVLAVVVVGALAAGGYARVVLGRSLPVTEGTIALTGLGRPVTVSRDALGVPTITRAVAGRSGARGRLRARAGAVLPDGPAAPAAGRRALGAGRRRGAAVRSHDGACTASATSRVRRSPSHPPTTRPSSRPTPAASTPGSQRWRRRRSSTCCCARRPSRGRPKTRCSRRSRCT